MPAASTVQAAVRAKPCCAIVPGPPTLASAAGPNWGKTTGMPPRMALAPSKTADSDVQSTSAPVGLVYFVTVAPCG